MVFTYCLANSIYIFLCGAGKGHLMSRVFLFRSRQQYVKHVSASWRSWCQTDVCALCLEFVEMSTSHSRDAQLKQFMQMYELRAVCNGCIEKHSHISYTIIATPHRCSHDVLLARAKVRGHRWSRVFQRPTHPRPHRYEVCWYFQEDVGCCMHRDRCTFASSPEEAAVWNLQKHTNLDHRTLIHLITQRKQQAESKKEDARSSSQELSSYQEKLLEEYRCSSNEILVVSKLKSCTR